VYDWTNLITKKDNGEFIFDDKGHLLAQVNVNSGTPWNVFGWDGIGLESEEGVGKTGTLTSAYPLFDGLGSVLTMTDQTNRTLANIPTDAFGVPTAIPNYDTPFKYTGRWGGYTDERVGVLNWHRWYNPELGRWLNQDPIRYNGGFYLFEYAANNPVRQTDSTGLKVQECCRPVQTGVPWQDGVSRALGLQHCYLKAGGKAAGAGPAGGGPLPSNPIGVPMTMNDASGDTGKCSDVPGVDEGCVSKALQIGKSLGNWSPINNCNTVDDAILDSCKSCHQHAGVPTM
jgi:RHS repeat-associated protein